MKQDLFGSEPIALAKVRIRRIKKINFELSKLNAAQAGWLLRSESARCEHCASSYRASAKAYQPDIDRFESEKRGLLAWLAGSSPVYCARLKRYKQWAVTSDGVIETWPFRSSHKHPLLAF